MVTAETKMVGRGDTTDLNSYGLDDEHARCNGAFGISENVQRSTLNAQRSTLNGRPEGAAVLFFFVSRIFTTLGIIFALDGIWWIVANRLGRGTRWRPINNAFLALQITALVWLVWGRLSGSGLDRLLPKFAVAALVIWHIILLPILVILCVVTLPI